MAESRRPTTQRRPFCCIDSNPHQQHDTVPATWRQSLSVVFLAAIGPCCKWPVDAAPTSTYQTIRCLDSLAPGAELASSSSDSSQQHFLLLKLPRQQLQDLPQLQQLVQQSVALRHPNVLQVHELFLTSQHLVVVQEGCSDCSLAQFLQQRRQQGRQLSEAAARCLFQQVSLTAASVVAFHSEWAAGLLTPVQHSVQLLSMACRKQARNSN